MKVRRLTRLILACIGDVTRDRRRQKRLARSVETLAMLWALCVK